MARDMLETEAPEDGDEEGGDLEEREVDAETGWRTWKEGSELEGALADEGDGGVEPALGPEEGGVGPPEALEAAHGVGVVGGPVARGDAVAGGEQVGGDGHLAVVGDGGGEAEGLGDDGAQVGQVADGLVVVAGGGQGG